MTHPLYLSAIALALSFFDELEKQEKERKFEIGAKKISESLSTFKDTVPTKELLIASGRIKKATRDFSVAVQNIDFSSFRNRN